MENRRPGKDEWDYREKLPPGRYRMTVTFERPSTRSKDPKTDPRWIGEVVSNAIDLTIEKGPEDD